MWIVPVSRPASAPSSSSAASRVDSACAARAARICPASVSCCRGRCARRAAARRRPRAGAGAGSRSAGRSRSPRQRRRRCPGARSRPAGAGGSCPRAERERAIGHGDTSHRKIRLADIAPGLPSRRDLAPFLYDQTACASYLFGCLSNAQLAVVDPHVELVDATWPRPSGSVRRSSPSSRRTCRPTTSPACRRSSRQPARPPTCRPGAGVEFEHVALADGEVVELGNTVVTRAGDAGARARPSRLRRRRPAPRDRRARGSSSPATRC